MAGSSMQIKTPDGKQFDAYVARPKATPAPAVIVIQEIFGVNPWLQSICDWLAESGFLAVAPDMFHRLEPGVVLTAKDQAEWDKAFRLYKAFDENKGVEDLIAAMNAVKSMPECNGHVGTLGFCLGGKLAFLMSARSEAECNVSFYGVGIENNLSEPVKHPILVHIAEADAHVPHEAQDAIKKTLVNNKLAQMEIYVGAGHAFGRPASEHYDEAAMNLARQRSLQFLKQHLASEVAAQH